jgi:hypothetical protein
MGCAGSLVLTLAGDVEDGTWDVELDDHERQAACSLALPDGTTTGSRTLSVRAEDGRLVATWTLSMGQGGGRVGVRLAHDGVTVLDTSFVPEWEGPDYPNGEACDDEGCWYGEAVLEF